MPNPQNTPSIPESITINGVTYLVKDTPELQQFIQSIAKVEKSKLYSQMENPLAVILEPNTVNYIYLERDGETREIVATKSTKKMINEGARTFRKILIAAVTTDDDSVTGIVYYHINIGYNDYKYHTTT